MGLANFQVCRGSSVLSEPSAIVCYTVWLISIIIPLTLAALQTSSKCLGKSETATSRINDSNLGSSTAPHKNVINLRGYSSRDSRDKPSHRFDAVSL
ncbi:hypothetical protein BDV24DRAFT_55863 [Aspergillus arachidicola]|uniref:Uncharacterized protein n=1 Tax=Aspergillus arachidicola TaxID=656916 RepID=A0A5N6Y8L3_9EURO|nr:hypothetical protein BDV24DRAFT_55863 [Aspergillus arachidicola]